MIKSNLFKINLLKTKTFWIAVAGLITSVTGIAIDDATLGKAAEALMFLAMIALRDSND